MQGCQHPHHHHPEHTPRDARPPDTSRLVADVLGGLRARGMRRTRLLEQVLKIMAARPAPLSIGQLGQILAGGVDPATLYRMVERLVGAGVVRRIGLQERALFYELVLPGVHRDYLICTDCGAIGDIHAECPVAALENELARETGYTQLRHELVFYGICPECLHGAAGK